MPDRPRVACSRPVEMIHPIYWLSSRHVDMIEMQEHKSLHEEFMAALKEEEMNNPLEYTHYYSKDPRKGHLVLSGA